MHMLAADLAADGQPAEARRLAGLYLKNQLTAKVCNNLKTGIKIQYYI
jgi:hypothetical protein